MEELIARVTNRTGLDAATATTAIGHILAFLQKEGPATEVSKMLAALPGSETAIAQANAQDSGGGLMGMLGGMMGGGGVMALGQKLISAGVPDEPDAAARPGAVRLWPRDGGRGHDGSDRRRDPRLEPVRLSVSPSP